MKGVLVTVREVCVLCGSVEILKSLVAAIQLAVSCSELYFVRCCALKWTGKYASESKVMCLN